MDCKSTLTFYDKFQNYGAEDIEKIDFNNIYLENRCLLIMRLLVRSDSVIKFCIQVYASFKNCFQTLLKTGDCMLHI